MFYNQQLNKQNYTEQIVCLYMQLLVKLTKNTNLLIIRNDCINKEKENILY